MRPRRQLVDQQLVLPIDEELDAQHAHDLQPLQDLAGDLHGLAGHSRRDRGRADRQVENMPAVAVLDRAVGDERAIRAAGRDDRDFALEVDERFQDRLAAGEFRLGINGSRRPARAIFAWPLPS